ncbi:hypothetical protein AM1_1312 [Acaryochloris marina MBIC11017]|uniref:Uncharacterized protein n=1 Tax=Acaryochloris marina (strain MBIC 11017) TaxID=329726 RepID=B0C5A6_ACAM1|nr:hypothetical protein AM1_1312 [Acaryochloris marina MBIC11017]
MGQKQKYISLKPILTKVYKVFAFLKDQKSAFETHAMKRIQP